MIYLIPSSSLSLFLTFIAHIRSFFVSFTMKIVFCPDSGAILSIISYGPIKVPCRDQRSKRIRRVLNLLDGDCFFRFILWSIISSGSICLNRRRNRRERKEKPTPLDMMTSANEEKEREEKENFGIDHFAVNHVRLNSSHLCKVYGSVDHSKTIYRQSLAVF